MRLTNKHPEDVKAAVRKTGISLAELARRNGLDETTTAAAIHRPQPSGNRAIAHHLDQKLHEIWPEWFDENGKRVGTQTTSKKTSRPAQAGHRQKQKAA